jgi:hypothetical protein
VNGSARQFGGTSDRLPPGPDRAGAALNGRRTPLVAEHHGDATAGRTATAELME